MGECPNIGQMAHDLMVTARHELTCAMNAEGSSRRKAHLECMELALRGWYRLTAEEEEGDEWK